MPNWKEVLEELQNEPSQIDRVRRRHLKALHEETKRNVIAYYSGWLQTPNEEKAVISDLDKNAFMTTIHGLDRSIGLDLILHTPGGETYATESLVDYLRKMFGTNIRVLVPQIAMSAGTMIACASKEIIMGKHSNLGPIDPQFGGIPCEGVKKEFEDACKEVTKDPSKIPIWQAIISKYHPTFIGECANSVIVSKKMVREWLLSGMFQGDDDALQKVNKILKLIASHDATGAHGRHLHAEQCIACGLKVSLLEDDDALQEKLLSVHHTFMHTFSNTTAIKIIENHNGIAYVNHIRPHQN